MRTANKWNLRWRSDEPSASGQWQTLWWTKKIMTTSSQRFCSVPVVLPPELMICGHTGPIISWWRLLALTTRCLAVAPPWGPAGAAPHQERERGGARRGHGPSAAPPCLSLERSGGREREGKGRDGEEEESCSVRFWRGREGRGGEESGRKRGGRFFLLGTVDS